MGRAVYANLHDARPDPFAPSFDHSVSHQPNNLPKIVRASPIYGEPLHTWTRTVTVTGGRGKMLPRNRLSHMSRKPVKTILVVEDDDNDLKVMELACARIDIPHQLKWARTGEEAIDYLAGQGRYRDRTLHPLPDLVFLDLKLYGTSGHEVLGWMRSQALFRHLPAIMLSGSDWPPDIERSYALGANSYLGKTFDFRQFAENLKTVLTYWLELNVPPTRPSGKYPTI